MYSNLFDNINDYTGRSDLSTADQAIAADVLVKWHIYEGMDAHALEYSQIAAEQWRHAARSKQEVMPSADLLKLLQFWANGCGGESLSQAVAAETLAELFWSVGKEHNDVESYMEAAASWRKAAEAWKGLYQAPVPVE